jgi:sec-independent protein translocase protein TatA
MFGSIGMPEMLVIFVIALIVFGPKKLPDLGRSLGKSIAEFKRASNELRNTLEQEVRLEEQREQQKAMVATPPAVEPYSSDPYETGTEAGSDYAVTPSAPAPASASVEETVARATNS